MIFISDQIPKSLGSKSSNGTELCNRQDHQDKGKEGCQISGRQSRQRCNAWQEIIHTNPLYTWSGFVCSYPLTNKEFPLGHHDSFFHTLIYQAFFVTSFIALWDRLHSRK